jgi:hypothetical protein
MLREWLQTAGLEPGYRLNWKLTWEDFIVKPQQILLDNLQNSDSRQKNRFNWSFKI